MSALDLIDRKEVGDRLRAAREKMNLTQKEVRIHWEYLELLLLQSKKESVEFDFPN